VLVHRARTSRDAPPLCLLASSSPSSSCLASPLAVAETNTRSFPRCAETRRVEASCRGAGGRFVTCGYGESPTHPPTRRTRRSEWAIANFHGRYLHGILTSPTSSLAEGAKRPRAGERAAGAVWLHLRASCANKTNLESLGEVRRTRIRYGCKVAPKVIGNLSVISSIRRLGYAWRPSNRQTVSRARV